MQINFDLSKIAYQPFTYDELIKPINAYNTEYNEVLKNLEQIDEANSVYSDAIMKDPNSPEAQIYQQYSKSLDNAVNILTGNNPGQGLWGFNRNNLVGLRRRFNKDIQPIAKAAKILEDMQKTARQSKAQGMLVGKLPSLHEIRTNPEAGFTALDPDKMYRAGQAVGAALGQNVSSIEIQRFNTYFDQQVTKQGIPVEQVYAMLEQNGSDFEKMMARTLRQFGINDSTYSAENIQRATEAFKNGAAIGAAQKQTKQLITSSTDLALERTAKQQGIRLNQLNIEKAEWEKAHGYSISSGGGGGRGEENNPDITSFSENGMAINSRNEKIDEAYVNGTKADNRGAKLVYQNLDGYYKQYGVAIGGYSRNRDGSYSRTNHGLKITFHSNGTITYSDSKGHPMSGSTYKQKVQKLTPNSYKVDQVDYPQLILRRTGHTFDIDQSRNRVTSIHHNQGKTSSNYHTYSMVEFKNKYPQLYNALLLDVNTKTRNGGMLTQEALKSNDLVKVREDDGKLYPTSKGANVVVYYPADDNNGYVLDYASFTSSQHRNSSPSTTNNGSTRRTAANVD